MSSNSPCLKRSYQIFKETLKENENEDFKDTRKTYYNENCDSSIEKLKADIVAENIKRTEEYLFKYPDTDPRTIKDLFDKDDLMPYFRFHMGFSVPPKTPYVMYMKKENPKYGHTLYIDVQPKYVEAAKKVYFNLSHDIRLNILWEFVQEWEAVDQNALEWSKDSKVRAALYDKWKYRKHGKKTPKILTHKKKALKFREVQMPDGRVTFSDEPVLEANYKNGFQLYRDVIWRRRLDASSARKLYNSLHFFVTEALDMEIYTVKTMYFEEILQYCESLNQERLRKYLGFRRVQLASILRVDFLEPHYPSIKYPVYKRGNQYATLEMANDSVQKDITPGSSKKRRIYEEEEIMEVEEVDSDLEIENMTPYEIFQKSIDQLKDLGYNLESSDSDSETD